MSAKPPLAFDAHQADGWLSGPNATCFGRDDLLAVTGDWNGNGRSKVGVLGPQGNSTNWWIDYGGVYGYADDRNVAFGLGGDVPIAGDWGGSGFSKIGVFRSGWWFKDYNGNWYWDPADQAVIFGLAGDKPLVAKRWR